MKRVVPYLTWMEVQAYSPATVAAYRAALEQFVSWCELRSVARADEVTRELLERYARHLALNLGPDGERLAARTRAHRLGAIRMWFRWLSKTGQIPASPAAELEMPKLPETIPYLLTAAEVAAVLAAPDLTTAFGMRDRAMLEVLYSTGLRRAELCGLELGDLELDKELVRVRHGKGNKSRLVPMGHRAAGWVGRYLDGAREVLLRWTEEPRVFLTRTGRPMGTGDLDRAVRRHLRAAGITKPGACHLFRHTMATDMLDGGADIRYVQMMLGHASIQTTQHYTQVALKKLEDVHKKTHPAERAHKDLRCPRNLATVTPWPTSKQS